jgi:hypothetical protein
MTSLFALLFLAVAGPYLAWMGVRSLRCGGWRQSVPLLEAVLDRAAGLAPPPRTAWDRRIAFAQAILFTAIGGVFTTLLIAALISFVSE